MDPIERKKRKMEERAASRRAKLESSDTTVSDTGSARLDALSSAPPTAGTAAPQTAGM